MPRVILVRIESKTWFWDDRLFVTVASFEIKTHEKGNFSSSKSLLSSCRIEMVENLLKTPKTKQILSPSMHSFNELRHSRERTCLDNVDRQQTKKKTNKIVLFLLPWKFYIFIFSVIWRARQPFNRFYANSCQKSVCRPNGQLCLNSISIRWNYFFFSFSLSDFWSSATIH